MLANEKTQRSPCWRKTHGKTTEAQREILSSTLGPKQVFWSTNVLMKNLPPIQMSSFQKDTTKLDILKLIYFLWGFRTWQELREIQQDRLSIHSYHSFPLRSSFHKSSATRNLRKLTTLGLPAAI